MDKNLFFDYSGVKFSILPFIKLNSFETFHFLRDTRFFSFVAWSIVFIVAH